MIYKPLSVQFEITESCTHKCKHCYNYYSHDINPSSTNNKIINKIAEQEFFDITITGGEPLCAKPQMYDAVVAFKKKIWMYELILIYIYSKNMMQIKLLN